MAGFSFQRLSVLALLALTAVFLFMGQGEAAQGPKITHKVYVCARTTKSDV